MSREKVLMKFLPYLFILFLSLWMCTSGNRQAPVGPPKPTNLPGVELAQIHCASCHTFPAPDLLDKATWEKGVLPEMAYRLGVKPFSDKMMSMDPDEVMLLVRGNVYPATPLLVEEDWQKIVQYYLENAPEKPLPQEAKAAITEGLPFFEIKSLPAPNARTPMVSMVKIDTANGQLYVSRRDKNVLEIYNNALKKIDSIQIQSPVADMIYSNTAEVLLLQMGIMDPNDQKAGKLIEIAAQKQATTLLDSLQRPVQLTLHDLNQDGTPDYLLCNYGNELGQLAWYDGKTQEEHVLKPLPGARITHLQDMNGDGLKDIIVLMCQSRESISIFYNRGKGKFEEKIVLEFPPVYGSSYLELADMNNDGHLDILYTNGDNADYSYVLKKYHGLRIFINDGKNQFLEQYFYPSYGASQVRAADFDADGDLDLAMISFFNEETAKPNEGFLFFENQGNLTFKTTTFSAAAQGKWLVMDVGDLDRDGKPDIVLGNFRKPGLGQSALGNEKMVSVVWLRNISKMNPE